MQAVRLAASPFVIFTPSRTGSTTLQRLMNCHPGIRCLWEPFNPTHPAIFTVESRQLVKSGGLEAAMKYLASVCNGFKHVWHVGGWPFDGDAMLNDRLLLYKDARIIILKRRNALQRAASERISQQMKVWTIYTDDDRRRIRDHVFEPLNIEQLREDMAVVQAAERRFHELIAASGKPWRQVEYEEIFSPGVSVEAAIEVVQSLLEFVGAERVTDGSRLEAMRQLLDPALTGFQNYSAYRKIPNILDVEKALGSEENGFVFEKQI